MKRGVVNPKPIIKKAPVLYLINYPATISFILHRLSNVSGRKLLLSNQCDIALRPFQLNPIQKKLQLRY